MKLSQGIRTDLAVEIKEQLETDGEIPGVSVQKSTDEKSGAVITRVNVLNKEGRKLMGKPEGSYITIEIPGADMAGESAGQNLCELVAEQLLCLAPKKQNKGVLVVGLGNREITPDALGPLVVEKLLITRHIYREFKEEMEDNPGTPLSALAPGVMAQTGMEAVEIIKGVTEETAPGFVIVVDALAARDTKRLNRTVQMTDTGISPGAGVGNNRNEISREVLKVPVIAVGVPTVIDAATIVRDTMERTLHANGLSGNEIAQFMNLLQDETEKMFVTPKDVDEAVRRIAGLIADGINMAFS